MKRVIKLCIILIFLLLSCEKNDNSELRIMTYNMYLMADSESDGDEYYPMNKDGGYGVDEYEKRIMLYQEFMLSDEGEADIYLLEEIESEKVLKDLMRGKMARRGYKYYAIAETNTPISVGFISRYKINDVFIHSNYGPRPIIELRLIFNGEEIRLFGLHAKSQLDGGEEERKSTFEHLNRLLIASYPSAAIALGDFNDDPRYSTAFSNVDTLYDSALKVTGDIGKVSSDVFYTPSLNVDEGDMTSYCYEGYWYSYDNAVMNSPLFDGVGIEYIKSEVITPINGLDEDGGPKKFSNETKEGYSDHLALKVTLGYI